MNISKRKLKQQNGGMLKKKTLDAGLVDLLLKKQLLAIKFVYENQRQMNKLKEMKNSCAEFAQDLKTGNVEWEIDENSNTTFSAKVMGKSIKIWINYPYFGDNALFNCESDFWHGVAILVGSDTAKEAAFEALELVKQEAQKLVDALSEKEPQKEPCFEEFKNTLRNIISGHPTKNKEQRVWKAAFDYCLVLANKHK